MPTKFNCIGQQQQDPLCPCQMKVYRENDYDLSKCGDIDNIFCLIRNAPRIETFGEGAILEHKEEYAAYVKAKKEAILGFEEWYEHTYG